MSLHLGNLTSRVRRDDLERVFGRFGRNSIRIKDKYGFVVYEQTENADRALRALQGRNISGVPVSITWSKRQPKPFKRFSKGSGLREPYEKRNVRKGKVYGIREEASNVAVGNGEEKFENVKEGVLDDHAESNLVDRGRWGEPVSEMLDVNGAEDEVGIDVDDYEPYHGYERKEEEENRYRAIPYNSSARRSSAEKSRKNGVVDTISKGVGDNNQLECYGCGRTGHIRRNCPRRDAFRRVVLRQRDSDSGLRVRDRRGHKRFQPPSRERLKSTKSPPPSRRSKRDADSLSSRKPLMLARNKASPSAKGMEYKSKMKRKRRDEDSLRESRKAVRAGSLPGCSNSTSSSSWINSGSPATRSCSRSRSKSASSRKHSSSSRSLSMSSKSRSENSRSRSLSVSSPSLSLSVSSPSWSLSVSLSQPVQCSPRKEDLENTGVYPSNDLKDDNRSEPKQFLTDQRPEIEDAYTENSKLLNTNGILSDKDKLLSEKRYNEINANHQVQQHEEYHELYKTGFEVEGPCPNLPEEGMVCVDYLSSESSGDRNDLKKSGRKEIGDTQRSYGKKNVEVPSAFQIKNSTNISPQEMHMVINQYGLAKPNENEETLSVESYFGSARLWPWEIIYYRRLKKGLISTENYARRIAQNEEFGIVDKYIRSSSGWEYC